MTEVAEFLLILICCSLGALNALGILVVVILAIREVYRRLRRKLGMPKCIPDDFDCHPYYRYSDRVSEEITQ
jgi:hypothetical protein